MPHSDPDKINPPDPIEQEDGSLEWPTDPDFMPTGIEEQNIEPVEGDDDDLDADFAEPDEGTDPGDEDVEVED